MLSRLCHVVDEFGASMGDWRRDWFRPDFAGCFTGKECCSIV
jgi:hypothetical protein